MVAKYLTKTKTYQYLAAFSGTLGMISIEMHYGWPSPSLPILLNGTYKIQIDSEEASWLAIMPPLGGFFGAIISGFITDLIGRKKLILFSAVPFFITWLMIGFADTAITLHIARFIAGLVDGISFIAVPMFLGEMAEPEIRGLLSSMCPVAIAAGLLFINIFGNYLTIPTTAFISAIFPLVLLLIFVWIPESPYSLLMKGQFDEAKASLKKFRGTENVEKELERLMLAVKEQNENTGKFLDLFTNLSNRKAMYIVIGLRSIQQFAGTTAISFYCKIIFNETKDFLSPNLATIVFYLIQVIISFVASLAVDILGRRPLLITSITGTGIALITNGIFLYIKNSTPVDVSSYNYISVSSLLVYVIFFSIGLQTIPILYISELFPTNVKAFALCLTSVYYCIVASAIPKLFHYTNENFGMHVSFFGFAVCCVVGLGFTVFYVPETKGKTLEDIQKYLKGQIKF